MYDGVDFMEEEITLVTAYFDIGRGEWGKFKRGDNKYISYFKLWARMKNKLIVYTNAEVAKEVLAIRESYGLRDQTQVIVIDDVRSCDMDIYQKIEKTMQHPVSRRFHRHPNYPESFSPIFNYVVLLKPYFVADAVKRNLVTGTAAWIDFGFNHGGELFYKPEEFDYIWKYDFTDKIHIFTARELDDEPIFQVVKYMDVYIRGNLIIAQDYRWAELWQLWRNAMVSLTDVGLSDDDQTISLMAYRAKPELFEAHYMQTWCLPLKLYGGEHFTMREEKKRSKVSLFFRNLEKKVKLKLREHDL